jgi:uncharacterized protein (UPF0335 family)
MQLSRHQSQSDEVNRGVTVLKDPLPQRLVHLWWRARSINLPASDQAGASMSEPGGVAGDQLRAFVERVEHIEEEIRSLTEDKKEIFAEAKGEGFDVKILKEVIRIRKQDHDERQEHESLLEVYLHALEDVEPQKKAA